MRKIRVLVVDDAVVVRRLVTDILATDPAIEVVGTAANGRLALAKLDQLAPDVVILDLEMPEMDGLETLVELRKGHPRLPVIMFSTLTERGALATLDALARGATDYMTKPANLGSVTLATERIRTELIPKIRALAGVRPARATPISPLLSAPISTLPIRADVLVIGVSTGGPNALAELLPALPAEFPVPIVIVQHMPPVFTRFMAERLAKLSNIQVREGEDGGLLAPGMAWLAPGNYHLLLRRDDGQVRLVLNQEAPENSCRPAVDPLFRSAAMHFGKHTLGLVLTGMGHDGLRGAEAIHRAGGKVLAQDESSSVVWGMPGAIATAGLADAVLSLAAIGPELVRRVAVGRLPEIPRGRPSSLHLG